MPSSIMNPLSGSIFPSRPSSVYFLKESRGEPLKDAEPKF